jgi:hypothetical protein
VGGCEPVRGGQDSQLDRAQAIAVAASQIGTTEATGRNDGEPVKYLASVGLQKGDPYCAAFVYWVGREALGPRNPYPRTGWSPSMVAGGVLVRNGGIGKPADTFGIYFPKLGRVGHTGFVAEWGKSSVVTIEANTNKDAAPGSAQDRDGGGVWKKKRLKASIYRVKDWIQ